MDHSIIRMGEPAAGSERRGRDAGEGIRPGGEKRNGDGGLP